MNESFGADGRIIQERYPPNFRVKAWKMNHAGKLILLEMELWYALFNAVFRDLIVRPLSGNNELSLFPVHWTTHLPYQALPILKITKTLIKYQIHLHFFIIFALKAPSLFWTTLNQGDAARIKGQYISRNTPVKQNKVGSIAVQTSSLTQ